MKRIAFICTGNTCRSPMAEAIMKQELRERGIKGIQVSSAGLYPRIGEPMQENARKALRELGVKQTYHKAAFADREFLQKYDLVLTMTADQREALRPFCKQVATVGELGSCGEIADPYGQDAGVYVATAAKLAAAIRVIVDKLTGKTSQSC